MWQAGTYYTIKVGTGAVDAAGHPLAQAAHALFTTRAPITAQLALTDPATGGASPATGFTVSFDGPVTPPSADALLSISPAVTGTLTDEVTTPSGTTVTFQPVQPLAANTTYTVAVQGGLVDSDGWTVSAPPPAPGQDGRCPGHRSLPSLERDHERPARRPGCRCGSPSR